MSAIVFQFGEFTFDCDSRQLLRSGMECHLSPKAQQLLRLLLLARPRALAREDLYDELWPSTFVCETNLTGVVNELRRALGDAGRKSSYVRTIHGFGYAFIGVARSTAAPSAIAATLTCEGKELSLNEGPNVVGRAPGVHVVLTDTSVSRRHAVIRVHDGAVSIQDLGSTNGTYVDGHRIGSAPVQLTPRSQVRFGPVVAAITSRKVSSTARLLILSERRRSVTPHPPSSDTPAASDAPPAFSPSAL